MLLPNSEAQGEPHGSGDISNARLGVIEAVCRLSSGNPLILRTLCERARAEPDWKGALAELGGEPFEDVAGLYDRILTGISPDALTWLKVLAATRIGLTLDEVSQVTGSDTTVLGAALPSVAFLFDEDELEGRRFRFYHVALRRWVIEQPWATSAVVKELHAKLSGLMGDSAASVLALEKVYHLYHAGQWSDVLNAAGYEHFDHLILEFASAARLLEDADFLSMAAARIGDLRATVRSALIRSKIIARFDLLFELGILPVYKTLIQSGRIRQALTHLGDMADADKRFGILLDLAVWALEDGLDEEGAELFSAASDLGALHRPASSPELCALALTCRLWLGEDARALISEALDTTWHVKKPGGGTEELEADQQVATKCELLRKIGEALVRRLGCEAALDFVDDLEGPYQLAIRLGFSDVDPANPDNGPLAIQLGLDRHSWGSEADKALTSLAIALGSHQEAIEFAQLKEQLPEPPVVRSTTFSREQVDHEEFLWSLKSRLLVGQSPEVSSAEVGREGEQVVFTMFYKAAVALIELEVMIETGAESEKFAEKLAEVSEMWSAERPWRADRIALSDVRGALRRLAARLLHASFVCGPDAGLAMGDFLFHLPSEAVGFVGIGGRLELINSVAGRPEARDWVTTRLSEVLAEVRSDMRETWERVEFLLKLADLARSLEDIDLALELCSEAVLCTKGMPGTDEEPRYYGLLETLEELNERGVDVKGHLRVLGRLIQASHGATNRSYAGHSWSWLLRIAAVADPPLWFDLVLSLEDDYDSGVPSAVESIRAMVLDEESDLPAHDWVALAWAGGPVDSENSDDITSFSRIAAQKLPTIVEDNSAWRNWALGASGIKAEEEAATWICDPNASDAVVEDDLASSFAALIEATADREHCLMARSGDRDALLQILAKAAHWLEAEAAAAEERRKAADGWNTGSSELKWKVESAVHSLLRVISSDWSEEEIAPVAEAFRKAGIRPARDLDLYLARARATRSPKEAADAARAELADSSWWDPEKQGVIWSVLNVTEPEAVRENFLKFLTERGMEPYWFVKTLRELPKTLCSDAELVSIFDTIAADVADSLEPLPPDPIARQCLEDDSVSNRTLEEFLRDLLHRRDTSLRRRAREALGILAHVRPQAVAQAGGYVDDLVGLPAYERLTAELGRLSVLWMTAELSPDEVVPLAEQIYQRYVAADGECSGHLRLANLGRKLLCRLAERTSAILSEEALAEAQSTVQPRRVADFEDHWHSGETYFYIERELEYAAGDLARLFRLKGKFVGRSIDYVAARLHVLSPEEKERDKALIDWRYGSSSRVLRTAQSDLIDHAISLLQKRWYESRVADSSCLIDETPAGLEGREFDPWQPASLIAHCSRTRVLDGGLELPMPDDQWAEQAISDLDEYVGGAQEGWIVVAESIQEVVGHRRVYSWVESFLADREAILEEAKDKSDTFYAVTRDLPSRTYLYETADDFDFWWNRWPDREQIGEGSRQLALYAEKSLANEEPLYPHVVRPLPVVLPACSVETKHGGLAFKNDQSGETVWLVDWMAGGEYRVLADADWLRARLRDLGVVLVIRRRVRRVARELEDTSFLRDPTAFAEFSQVALADSEGGWESL